MIVTAAPDVYLVGFALHLPVGVWDTEGYMLGWLGNFCLSATHSSYLSQPPQPAVVYFFLAGVLFSIENAKCWPNLANFDQFWLFCREFTEFFGVLFIDLNNAAVY